MIVNGYFPESRLPVRLTHEIPNTTAPIFLAGMFSDERCEIRLHNEVSHGFVELYAPELLEWPDMLVLTSMTFSFDRLLHLTAYARTANPKVVVVAGGIGVRSFPTYARRFFDYACAGDFEEIREVITAVYGADHVAEDGWPRYDLAPWNTWLYGFAEASRNCQYRCSYCSLTPLKRKYAEHDHEFLRRQIVAMGTKYGVSFLDNQFNGADPETFRARLSLLEGLRDAGHFRRWSALTTSNFLWDRENLRAARKAGCIALFVGLESFDSEWLATVNKKQNNKRSQVDLIQGCIEEGIVFQYGTMVDPTTRTLAEIRRELDFICESDRIPTPLFMYAVVPFPGTPLFRERAKEGALLPNTRVRDLEGSTLTMRSLDPPAEFASFLAGYRREYRARWLRHEARFLMRNRRHLDAVQIAGSAASALSFLWPVVSSEPRNLLVGEAGFPPRTHVSGTDRLDCVYVPHLPVADRYRSYFQPTFVTDAAGRLNEDLADDLLGVPWGAERRVSLPLLESA